MEKRKYNLKNTKNTQFSGKRAVELGRKGGIQYGINHKANKAYNEQLKAVIEIGTQKALEKAKKEKNIEMIKMIEEGGLIAYEHFNIATNKDNPPELRLKAFDMMLDRLEGKPTQKTENLNLNVNEITPDEKLIIENYVALESKKK